MKKIIYSLSFFLVFSFLLETANAQSGSPIPQSNTLPGTTFKIPQISDFFRINAPQRESNGAGAMVYPNPCNGQFTLRFNSPNGGKTGIIVSDNKGNGMIVVETLAVIGTNVLPLSVKGYGPGTYSVTVSGGGMVSTLQVVVNR
jgi:hypothetical protein